MIRAIHTWARFSRAPRRIAEVAFVYGECNSACAGAKWEGVTLAELRSNTFSNSSKADMQTMKYQLKVRTNDRANLSPCCAKTFSQEYAQRHGRRTGHTGRGMDNDNNNSLAVNLSTTSSQRLTHTATGLPPEHAASASAQKVERSLQGGGHIIGCHTLAAQPTPTAAARPPGSVAGGRTGG